MEDIEKKIEHIIYELRMITGIVFFSFFMTTLIYLFLIGFLIYNLG